MLAAICCSLALLGSPDVKRPPLLLYIPGGGFVQRNDASELVSEVADNRGYDFRSVGYPLNNPLGAFRAARRQARRAQRNGRDVYLYGESAGGTIAARLAQMGFGRAAAVNAPPTDLTKWSLPGRENYWEGMQNNGMGTRRFLSPALQGPSKRPIMVQQSPTDTIVPGGPSREWARRDPRVHMSPYEGHHVGGESYATYPQNIRGAFNFLDRVRDRPAPAAPPRRHSPRRRPMMAARVAA